MSSVAFTAEERMDENAAKNQIAMNVKNTVFYVNVPIGRQFSDAAVQEDMKHWSFEVVRGDGDKPLIQVEFKGETKRFTPEVISSVVLTKCGRLRRRSW